MQKKDIDTLVARDMARVRRLVRLIAKEHRLEVPEDFDLLQLLEFLDGVGIDRADFFATVFGAGAPPPEDESSGSE